MRELAALVTVLLACVWLPAATLAADTGNEKNEKPDAMGAKKGDEIDERHGGIAD